MDNDWAYEKHFASRAQCAGYWHDKSVHLHEAAEILSENEIFDGGDTYRMLMGLSFELMFKAFFVANGKKPAEIHKLHELSIQSGIEFSDRERGILKILTGYIVWEGKYPIPKETKKSPGPQSLKDQWGRTSGNGFQAANLFDTKVSNISEFTEDDLSFTRLKSLWQKINSEYIQHHL